MEILFTIAVIGFIIYSIVKWLNKNEKESKNVKEAISSEVYETNNINVQPEKKKSNTLVKNIEFIAVGTAYPKEGNRTGQDILNTIVNIMRREDYFYDKYEGMTNKEIKEDTFGERIYELYAESIPVCELELEDDNQHDPNAIKVMAGIDKDSLHHIGYVPKEHCEELRNLMKQFNMHLYCSIYGGKFKYVDYDEYGEDKVFTDSTPYGLELSVSFHKNTIE